MKIGIYEITHIPFKDGKVMLDIYTESQCKCENCEEFEDIYEETLK